MDRKKDATSDGIGPFIHCLISLLNALHYYGTKEAKKKFPQQFSAAANQEQAAAADSFYWGRWGEIRRRCCSTRAWRGRENSIFLPAAKPSGPRTVIGVVIIVVGGTSLSEHNIAFYLYYTSAS